MQIGKVINHSVGTIFYLIILVYFGLSLTDISLNYINDILNLKGLTLNLVVLLAELIGPIYATYFTIQLIDGLLKVNEVKYDITKITNYPKVDVLIPIHNVQPKMLEEVLEGCRKLSYPNHEVMVGDDNSEERYAKACEEVVKKYNFKYHYEEKRSFKAGIINRLLERSNAKYIFMLDSDQIPEPDIIEKFIAILEEHPEYAYVQAKYKFTNVKTLLNVWDAMAYCQLFCAQIGKRHPKSVLFGGTSSCVRKELLYPLPQDKLSEDFDKTITLAAKGCHGYSIDDFAAKGFLAESFEHKMSQQFRWCTGQIGAVKDHLKDFLFGKMRIKQFIDYFMVSTFVFLLATFYFVALFYVAIYFMNIPVPRALGMDQLAFVVMPIVFGVVYFATFMAVGVYSSKANVYNFKFWHVPFFMLFGGMVAPFLIIPSVMGLFGKNKIKGKKNPWNRRIRLVTIGTFYSIAGLFFTGMTVITLIDFLSDIIQIYTGQQFFFNIFISAAFMLGCGLPFVLISKKIFKKPQYYLDDANIFY